MTNDQDEIDPEIKRLMEEKAEIHGVPLDLLIDIYREERRVVNMDLRQDIHTNIRDRLEDHGESWEPK